MNGPRILLVVGGGIAAYKACELVRTIRKQGGSVTCVLTDGGARFVTPMTLAALSENPVHTTLWDLKNEAEMGHIQLSRQADLVVVCPATADLLAKMAAGMADDLATTLLLATDKPVMAVPAMNVRMWQHAATLRNVATLRGAGVDVMEPDEGPMACGEFGPGRLPEVVAIWQRIAWALGLEGGHEGAESLGGLTDSLIARGPRPVQPFADAPPPPLAAKGTARAARPTDPDALDLTDPLVGQPDFDPGLEHRPLYGRHVLVTAGPTHEPIDPVRYIANRSSGKQGFAIAAAAAAAGARVTLVAGPVHLPTPPGVERIDVETAREMAEAVDAALPADVAVMVAAVADWRVDRAADQKLKKVGGGIPALELTENPDILAGLGRSLRRPPLVIGFAAETQDVIAHATEKRTRKNADWIVANDVSGDVMGGDANTVHIVTAEGVTTLPEMPKGDVARVLVERIADALPR
jgi:phosphopantothenoylcysteine decarboxylase/phosphopantothenate--cysteine ligase